MFIIILCYYLIVKDCLNFYKNLAFSMKGVPVPFTTLNIPKIFHKTFITL